MKTVLAEQAKRLAGDERGMTTVEYVIALCLVGAVAVGTWSTFGATIAKRLGQATVLIGDATQMAPTKEPLNGAEEGQASPSD